LPRRVVRIGGPSQAGPARRQGVMTRRPVFLDLFRIALPIGAIASFLHRISGVLLVVALPAIAILFERSLATPEGFESLRNGLGSATARLGMVLLGWALAHHVLAGIRHMLMDAGLGWRLADARRSAWAVVVGGLA